MSPCAGCMKVRRALIQRTPEPIRERLTRAFLPGEPVTTAADVVREARTWVGVPFLHQGRQQNGIDCWGVPVVVLRAFNALPEGFDDNNYPRAPLCDQIEERLSQFCKRLTEPVPGCLIALKFARTVTHVAILTDTDTLIHALERHEAVVEHGFRGMWRTRYYGGAWALPGVAYG